MAKRNRPIAVFDIDDTLADLANPFAKYMRDKYDDDLFLEDLRNSGIRAQVDAKYPSFDVMAELYGLEDVGTFKTLPLITRTYDVYRRLQEAGHEMWLITARGWMLDGEGETIDWMVHHGITCDRLKVVDLMDCKSMHFPERAAVYYDDHHGHVLNCADRCDEVYMVQQPWNTHLELPSAIKRFKSI